MKQNIQLSTLQFSFYRGVHHRRCMEDEDEDQPSWTCVNSSFKYILISINLRVCRSTLWIVVVQLGSMAELALIMH